MNHRHIIVAGINGDSCGFVTQPINGAVTNLEKKGKFSVSHKGDLPTVKIGELEDPENTAGIIIIHRIKCEVPYLLATGDHKKPSDKVHAKVRAFVRA